MNKFYHVFFIMVIILFLFVFHAAGADGGQPTHDGNIDLPESDIGLSFRPSIAIVIGILGFMFALTFLLIIYAKFCHVASSSVPFTFGNDFNEETDFHLHGFIPTRSSRFSGIDKTLIESLPFFKFSSLKGSKQGLECAVCLSKFEDSEILRLLPKCKHAFHINCVDQWLESHSSCPLCRRKVNIEDLAIFTLSTSSRSIFHNPSSLDLRDDSNFELFVEREEDDHGSSRFSIGSSFRKYEKGKKEDKELLLTDQDYGINDHNKEGLNENSIVVVDEGCDANKQLHKFKHKIIVSDIVYKNRWSDVNSSDLMLLNSEMLNFMSSKRFASGVIKTNSTNCDMSCSVQEISAEPTPLMKIREEMERKRLFENKINSIRNDNSEQVPNLPSTSTNPNFMSSSSSNNRSISEITVFSRSGDSGVKNKSKDERLKRVWYPIARRTVQWIVGRERRTSEQLPQQNSRLFSVV